MVTEKWPVSLGIGVLSGIIVSFLSLLAHLFFGNEDDFLVCEVSRMNFDKCVAEINETQSWRISEG